MTLGEMTPVPGRQGQGFQRPVRQPRRAAQTPRPYAALRRHYWIAVLCLLPMPLVYVLVELNLIAGADLSILTTANTYGPIYGATVLAFLTYACVRTAPETIWTAFFWFPLQSFVFFYFGPLVNVLGSDVTIYSRAGHPLTATPLELLRANMLISVAVPLVLAGMAATLSLMAAPAVSPDRWRDANRDISPDRLAPLAIAIILIGALFRYGLMKPADWGLIAITVPGVLTSLGFLLDLGIAMLAYCAALRGGQRWVVPLIVLWGAHAGLTLLSFAKVEMVVALVFPILAIYLARRRFVELLAGALVVAVAFTLATPLVTHGRATLTTITGDPNTGGYRVRAATLVSYVTSSPDDVGYIHAVEQPQRWWVRLDYATPMAKAMTLYDSGTSTSTVETFWMRFIPRVLWPEKPILEGPGRLFYSTILQRDTETLVAISIYGDSYWHYGWIGVVIICPLVGFLFAYFGRLALGWVINRQYIYFPLVLYMILWVGNGVNKYLINGVLGALPLIIVYMIILSLADKFLRSEFKYSIRRKPARRI